jgi:pteridine reductase
VQKTVLITGAAKRIGAACATLLHQQDYNLLLHYRNSQQQARQLCDYFNRQRPDSADIIQADLLKLTEIKRLAHYAATRWESLDVLINNASDFYPQKIRAVEENNWDQLMGCNLKAPFFLTQNLIPSLKKSQGCVINIIDIHAEKGLEDYPVYSLSKAGLAAMTKILAKELAPDIRVNGVSPGAILWPETDTTLQSQAEILQKVALKRSGHPEDIAQAVAFFIQKSPYITGQIMNVDGGRTLFS